MPDRPRPDSGLMARVNGQGWKIAAALVMVLAGIVGTIYLRDNDHISSALSVLQQGQNSLLQAVGRIDERQVTVIKQLDETR